MTGPVDVLYKRCTPAGQTPTPKGLFCEKSANSKFVVTVFETGAYDAKCAVTVTVTPGLLMERLFARASRVIARRVVCVPASKYAEVAPLSNVSRTLSDCRRTST